MWNLLNTIAMLICLSACGTGPETPGGPAELTVGPVVTGGSSPLTSDPITDPSPTPSSSPVPLVVQSVTYYQLTQTVATVTGHPPIIGTGSCVVYASKTYCWDDGIKTVIASTFYITYFGVNELVQHCYDMAGGCTTDLFARPILITNHLINTVRRLPSDVLSTGTPAHADCTVDNGTLDCGTFRIDLNQAPL